MAYQESRACSMPENDEMRDRAKLGFAKSVLQAFSFLAEFGYSVARAEPTFVRYEYGTRFVNVFHGRRSYALGVEFGDTAIDSEAYSLKEIRLALEGRGGWPSLFATTASVVETCAKELARQTRTLAPILNGDIPRAQIAEYSRRLTEYYSGKSDTNPNRGRLP
jgi:hypothetical protein